ncbi:MAG: bifunctional 3,4-dihydroxy-2-butanone-4-phosphate synthase/GTP cyclohydrolase II, partial [Haliea sp.]|nr:bifunctional 3,4-dihydroxy-2-butanone-4-phosphate synthase/GTP cyclohydrolase II [Haliea sp.]
NENLGALVLIGQPVAPAQALADVIQYPDAPKVTGGRKGGVGNYRVIGTGAQILKRIGVSKMRLMSAPLRFNALSGFNLEVTEFVQPDPVKT